MFGFAYEELLDFIECNEEFTAPKQTKQHAREKITKTKRRKVSKTPKAKK